MTTLRGKNSVYARERFTFQRTHQHKKPKSIASRFTVYLIKRRKYFKYMAIYMNLTPRHGAENALGPNLE